MHPTRLNTPEPTGTALETHQQKQKSSCENLRAARENQELTQERLAELSGVQPGEISRIETGQTRPPGLDAL